MQRLALVALLLGTIAGDVVAAEADAVRPLADVLAEAASTGKPVVIDFYTTWCTPCKAFDAQIYPDAAVQAALGGVIYVKYDAEDGGEGLAAAERYEVSSFPMFLALDETGAVRARFQGMPETPAPFVAFVESAISTASGEAAVTARVKAAGKDARVLLGAARWYAARRRTKEALALYDRAVKADKGNKLGVAAESSWEASRVRRAAKLRAETVAAALAYVTKYPSGASAEQALRVAVLSGDLTDKQVRAVLAGRRKALASNATALNSVAYVALAVGAHDEALAAAERAVELAPKDPNALDTLAEVHHYRGEKDKALAAADLAIAAVGDGEDEDKKKLKIALRENRSRFAADGKPAPSNDVEREKTRARAYFAALEAMGEAQSGTQDGGGDDERDAEQKAAIAAFQAFFSKARKAYDAASSACTKHAGKLPEAYVRIELPEAGGKPTRVVVLEPDAPPKLKKCLVDTLSKETFPKPPAMYATGRYTDSVSFQSSFGIKVTIP